MHASLSLADAEQRQRALDPSLSFIVQAPAGSGKTELLVQRFLVLLTRVQTPEVIIAITFTRKAANEMRLRIIQALEHVHSTTTPPTGKDTQRYQLAKKVLAHDQRLGWNLLANPNRLRIVTIDSFCKSLTRQMPLLSSLGENFTPVDHPECLYRMAVQELLKHLEDKLPWQAALIHLLSHLDNHFQRVENLFIDMLAKREQWLNYLLQHQQDLRQQLEQGLLHINEALVEKLNQLIPDELSEKLMHSVNFSLQQRQQAPLVKHNDLNFWQAASKLLLTAAYGWRKQLRKAEGFPAAVDVKNKAEQAELNIIKKQLLQIIEQLSQQHLVKETLIALKQAPPLKYSESQWQIFKSLFELLPVLVAHLKIIFQQQEKVDYTEILLAACAALGSEENPSDLALCLDYQIEHLLVDEFQDTSSTQLHLIEKLTAGWQEQDGRSLFLVGDPMQSIYRFRKAEVGLFLQVQREGIGAIRLHALSLCVNFRSDPAIVGWVNAYFSQLLPQPNDIHQDELFFSQAVAYAQEAHSDAVCTYWQRANDSDPISTQKAEAQHIVKLIQQLKQRDAQSSIVILVRARKHLSALLPALSNASIAYQAIEIDSLAEKSVVQDLLALTRALHHLGDRISWFALLRSPYCGLSLSDLYHITQFSDEKIATPTIWKQLQHYEKIPLSTATKQRLSRLVPILQQSLQQQGRIPLPLWVKQTWLQLGGPTSLLHWDDMRHIDAFLNFLTNKIKLEGEHFDFFKVTDELNNIYTQTTAHASAHLVDIMTIHQAKGLEYDHVILPGLHRRGRVESSPLLLYSEKMREQQRKDFLLAPIKASHEEQDLIYNYLFSEEKKKSDAELTRLLYVACTRAKKSLHLFATLSLDEKGSVKPPAPLSLFSHLWPVLHIQAEDLLTCTSAQTTTLLPAQGLLKRLPADWQAPIPNQIDINPGITSHAYAYHWQLHPERILGTVIHRLLYQISQDGITHWNREKISAASTMFAQLLAQNGLLEPQIAEALVKLNTCLTKTLSDERGRWILNPQHRSAQSEFAVTAVLNGQVQSLVMDRSFIDTDTGIRWIIDYKTTDYQGNTPEDFLKAERQQHQEQLNTYAQALLLDAELCGSQTLRCGLYLPLTSLWCEWEFTEASVAESIQG